MIAGGMAACTRAAPAATGCQAGASHAATLEPLLAICLQDYEHGPKMFDFPNVSARSRLTGRPRGRPGPRACGGASLSRSNPLLPPRAAAGPPLHHRGCTFTCTWRSADALPACIRCHALPPAVARAPVEGGHVAGRHVRNGRGHPLLCGLVPAAEDEGLNAPRRADKAHAVLRVCCTVARRRVARSTRGAGIEGMRRLPPFLPPAAELACPQQQHPAPPHQHVVT